jgi:outer membrane protein assembly factor BamB
MHRWRCLSVLLVLGACGGAGEHPPALDGGVDAPSWPGSFDGGAAHPRVKWSFAAETFYYSAPALAPDGTIYAGTSHHFSYYNDAWKRGQRPATGSYRLYAFDPAGTVKWEYADDAPVRGSPALGVDGTIYVVFERMGAAELDTVEELHAISPAGQRLWKQEICQCPAQIGNLTPSIGSDGTIYVLGRTLTAFAPDGTKKWAVPLGPGNIVYGAPAIGPDGTIYSVFWTDNWQALRAFDPAGGAEKWTGPAMGTYPITASPSIGKDGMILSGGQDEHLAGSDRGALFAISATGQELWRFSAGDFDVRSSASVDEDGTIYFGTHGANDYIHALAPDGTLKWSYRTRADVTAGGGADVYSSPAIAADGTIYVANEYGFVYAFRRDGTLRWKDDTILPRTGGSNWSSFAIGGDGTLYIGRTYGVFMALRGDGAGLSTTALWPKYRGGSGNTGRRN